VTLRQIGCNAFNKFTDIAGALEAGSRPGGRFFVSGVLGLRTTTPFEDKIMALIEPPARDAGFEIVRIRLRGNKRKTLEIRAEREDGTMTADDCEVLSHAISPVLEVDDPLQEAWALEVSSPGIDRPLTRIVDFQRWEGFEARIELDRLVEGRKRFSGILSGTEEGNVGINLKGEDQIAMVPFDWISDARLVLTDELIEATLRRRKAGDPVVEGAVEEDLTDLEIAKPRKKKRP
jgi:ribosome maturation factor RimP